ncbi:glycosyl hydrolase family 28-related protein [Candidatus Bathycorpusculum sp.]|uniref:right-handed parallel beta-helix repeat-containing protein n=1 Tax=Candidatus Bathycorpusculum sp. TaxID=2994959 RepID=UPI00282CC9E4|nr:hypothetical protein [Candidatus Termitimicrobium sp.]MCL2431135.1 hypothetical protein [Candidatus Termitimicrobium sp.]
MRHIKMYKWKHSSTRFDLVNFGAKGDGVTDDTQAINSAISAAEASGGGIVVFPKGIFKCMAVRPKSTVTLQGQGWGESILKGFDDKSNNAIIDGTGYFSQTSPLTEFSMYDLELDGKDMNRNGYHYNRKGIGNQWIKNAIFHNIFVHDTPATGIGTDFTINVYFTDSLVKDCGTEGKVGNGIGSNGFGIGVGDVTEVVVFSGCQAIGIANNGFTLEAQTTQGIGYASITDCYTERCHAGYSNSGSRGVTIDGCIDNSSKLGVYISSNASKPGNQTLISDCQFIEQQSHGVYSDDPANNHLQIRGCLFEGCGGSAIKSYGSYCSFTNNIFKGCREPIILCQPGTNADGKGYLITDNLILNGGASGIQIDSTKQVVIGMIVKDNIILDCRGPGIKAICKDDMNSGNYTASVIDGNVCNSNSSPQIDVPSNCHGLIVRNNIE